MKFHLASTNGNLFTAHAPGSVSVNGREYRHGCIVTPDQVITPWGEGAAAGLTDADFAAVAELGPEIVVLGTGARQVFPPPRLLRALIQRNVGVEVMDTAAACRTYNILASEGRKVVAAVLPG